MASKRRRMLLSSYYGLGDREQATTDPLDIDGAAFDVSMYFDRLLQQRSVEELVQEDNSLVADVRNLDSEMQTLVYQNYNKFIDATDTIRQMKGRVESMEDEMEQLQANIEKITGFNEGISDSLSEGRESIRQLSGVHALLRKLQFLFELPARLRKCNEMQLYSQAVKYYTEYWDILEAYSHLPSFTSIKKDIEDIIAEVQRNLKEQIAKPGLSNVEVAEVVDLLLHLRESPEVLRDEYTTMQVKLLSAKLDMIVSERHAGRHPDGEKGAIEWTLEQLHTRFLPPLAEFVDSYRGLFMRASMSRAQRAASDATLTTVANSLLERYMEYMEDVMLSETNTDLDDLRSSLAVTRSAAEVLEETVPKAMPVERYQTLASTALRHHIGRVFETLNNTTQGRVADMHGAVEASGGAAAAGVPMEAAAAELAPDVLAALGSLKPLQQADEDVCKVVHVAVQEFLMRQADLAMEYVEVCRPRRGKDASQQEASRSPVASLCLCRYLMLLLEGGAFSAVAKHAARAFPTGRQRLIDVDVVEEHVRSSAKSLLDMYVHVQGHMLSQMVRKSVETKNWMAVKREPRDVRKVVDLLLEELQRVKNDLGSEHMFPGEQRSPGELFVEQRGTRGHANNRFHSNINRMFSSKGNVFSTLEFKQYSILSAMITVLLKTFIESVRARTLNKNALQQIQVDMHYLHTALLPFVEDAELLGQLLDEVQNSAEGRCVEPLLLEASVVESICNQRKPAT